MRQTEEPDGILSRMARDLFTDAHVKRIQARDGGELVTEWFLVLEYPTEICLGTSFSMTLNMWKLLKAVQLSSQKSGRIGHSKHYQRPLEIEREMRKELSELIHNRLQSPEVESFVREVSQSVTDYNRLNLKQLFGK